MKRCAPVLPVLLLLAWSCLVHVDGAKRKTRQRRELLALQGPCDEPIWDSGLLERTLSYVTLVEKSRQYHHASTGPTAKRTQGSVLGYVTPWNSQGYCVAVQWRHKLTHVSPVWYQLRAAAGGGGGSSSSSSGPFELVGGHEYNATWLRELREGGNGPRVVPRVVVELPSQAMVTLLQSPGPALELIAKEVEARGYDGIVLEVWLAWVGMNGMQNAQFRAAAFALVKHLGDWLQARGKDLILAVPPIFPAGAHSAYTERAALVELAPHVTAWSVMTYDYTSSQGGSGAAGGGPNAPLQWFEDNLHYALTGSVPSGKPDPDASPLPEGMSSRLLMGLNFYGWDYDTTQRGMEAVTGSGLLKLLRQHSTELEWEEEVGEHSVTYTDASGSRHKVYYPTPRSLQLRIEAAGRASAGLSIWELGQGLERFVELL